MRGYSCLFAVVVAGACLGEVPTAFDFPRFAFGDAGWAMTVNRLLDDGLVPTKDFAYFYGLLALSANRALFAVFGEHAGTVGGVFVASAALIGLGMWRWARAVGLGVWPRGLLLLLLIPLAANPGRFPSPAHAMEAVLLVHAVAAHAGGRLGQALALTTLAVLIKPSLGYFLGLFLVLQILVAPGAAGRWKRLLPAALLGAAILAYLTAAFGFDAVLKTQLPFEGSKEYRAQNFGFFHGDGQVFWKPQPGREPVYYFVTPAGGWLASTVVLTVGGLAALRRVRSDTAARSVVAAAALHAVFVCVLFGNRFSWFYYPFLPVAGAVVALDRFPRWLPRPVGGWVSVAAGAAVGFFAVMAFAAQAVGGWRTWQGADRDPRVAGLYAPTAFIDDWSRVRAAADDGGVFVLAQASAAWALTPGVESPRVWVLSRVVTTPADWARVRTGIGRCRWLLVPDWFNNSLLEWPELTDAVAPFEPAESGVGFTLYRRRASPPP